MTALFEPSLRRPDHDAPPGPAADVDALPAGTAVGSFVLGEVQARDEFCIVYRADSSASGTEVTIEEYLPSALARRDADGSVAPRSAAFAELWAEGLQAFLQEADQLSRLNHPALLRIGPVWRTRGTAYRLRAGGEGRPLLRVLAEMGQPPSEAWLRRLLLPLLDALELVHAAGWVHGNVRPGQVLMKPDGLPVLLDSGGVRLAIGTRLPKPSGWPEPAFLPVELTEVSTPLPVGPWSDLYSLAALGRFCLGGEMPADGKEWRRGADGASGLQAALDRSLAPDPADRLQSAAEFRHAIKEGATAASPVPAPRAQPESPLRTPLPAPPQAPSASAASSLLFSVTHRAQAAPSAARVGAAGLAPLVSPREPDWDGAATRKAPPPLEPDAGAGGGGMWIDPPASSPPPRPDYGFGARPRGRRWPWALAGAAGGALVAAAMMLFIVQPNAEVQWMLAAPSAGPAPASVPAPQPPAAAAAVTPAPPAVSQQREAAGLSPPQATAPSPAEDLRQQAPRVQTMTAPSAEATAAPPGIPQAESVVTEVATDRAAPKEGVQRMVSTPPRTGAAAQTTTAADAPVRRTAASPAASGREDVSSAADNPAAVCSPRTNFSLYRCMQNQCEQRRFFTHPQCIRLRVRDEVS